MSTSLDFLFRNENFIALNKPAGVLSTPPRFLEKDQRLVLGRELEKAIGQQVYPIHRLDFEVGGVVLFALTVEAHRAASEWFAERNIQKVYQAITERPFSDRGLEPGSRFRWQAKVLRGKKRTYEHQAGKTSITEAEVIKLSTSSVLWRVLPVTGRPHQLRFDLSRNGFPIWGDRLYGSAKPWGENQIALQAVELILSQVETEKWGLPKSLHLKQSDRIESQWP